MIRLDRSTVPVPATLNSPLAVSETARIREFFTAENDRGQKRYEFRTDIYRAPDVCAALAMLSHNKCGYCEGPLTGADAFGVDHFRPKLRALSLDGHTSPDHYWWLVYRWDNLLPSCHVCNRSKAVRFPVLNKRAGPSDDLRTEESLLLDPCLDEPGEHLVFADDGLVVGLTKRGEVTIDILNLNRPDLIKGRQVAIATSLVTKRSAPPSTPYSAACNQALARLAPSPSISAQQPRGKKAPQPVARPSAKRISHEDLQNLSTVYRHAREVKQAAYSVDTEQADDRATYYSGAKHIERLTIHNFKAIEHLEISFPRRAGEREPWVMLLGENGTGKSSILQAVALTLMGQTHCDALGLDASKVIRQASREPEARVEIGLTGLDQPARLIARRDSPRFIVEPKEPKVLLMGYGATRLIPQEEQALETRPVSIRNLFVPTAPLNDGHAWLANPSLDAKRFDLAAAALKDLMLLEDEDRFVREGGHVWVHTGGTRLSLDQLSDGLQSVFALATDIMMTTQTAWESPQDAEGIVLLDEIEVHLHPSWKLQIIPRLRRTFPRLTFLVTTHDPLCLRGLDDGEIMLLRRDAANRVELITEVPSVAHLRADQILTSFLFALPSTRTRDPAATVARYSQLLGKDNRNAKEDAELHELEVSLNETLLSGETNLQRQVEKAVQKTFLELQLQPEPNARRKPELAQDVKFEIRRQLSELLGPKVPPS